MGRRRQASAEKASHGGRKAAFRTLDCGTATSELIIVSDGFEELSTASEHPDAGALQTTLMQDGEADAGFVGREGVQAARTHHSRVRGNCRSARSRSARPTRRCRRSTATRSDARCGASAQRRSLSCRSDRDQRPAARAGKGAQLAQQRSLSLSKRP